MPTFMQKWLVIICLYMFDEVAEGLILEWIRGQKSHAFRQGPVHGPCPADNAGASGRGNLSSSVTLCPL